MKIVKLEDSIITDGSHYPSERYAIQTRRYPKMYLNLTHPELKHRLNSPYFNMCIGSQGTCEHIKLELMLEGKWR